MTSIFWIIALIVLIAVVIALAAAFYERGSNAVSLVRTGIGGRRVAIEGGLLALPWFHDVARVNMQTIRLDVERRADKALITRDKLRIDVGAEFYLSVPPQEGPVARAAQALGRRSFQADELRNLLEGIFIDALRSVAATRSMDELHEGRAEFMARIREAVGPQVLGYGLQLDAVALTALDQTPFSALDENNAFNAEGLRKLSQVIAQSKRERAEIESETQVSVRRAAMEAARQRLDIDLEERRAEIAQAQQVEALMSAQLAEVARGKAEAERAAAEARIEMEQKIQTADIAREQAIREAEIARARALELAEQERAVMVAAKSQDESRAMAEADLARADAVRAEAEAERRRILSRISAEAEAEASARRAEIGANAARNTAEAHAQTTEIEVAANLKREQAQIEALRARITVENARSPESLAHEAELARLEAMPKIVAEMVKPAEKIGNINVTQVGTVEGSRGAVLQALESVLEQTVHAPGLNRLLERARDDMRMDDTRRRRDREE
jgi:flotillin